MAAKAFRATLWFKKGDLDIEAAVHAAASGDDLSPGAADLLPAEDRYLDDGSVTAADTAAYSLLTRGTIALPRAADSVALPAGNVDVLLRDIKRGRAGTIAALVAALSLACAAAILYALSSEKKGRPPDPRGSDG